MMPKILSSLSKIKELWNRFHALLLFAILSLGVGALHLTGYLDQIFTISLHNPALPVSILAGAFVFLAWNRQAGKDVHKIKNDVFQTDGDLIPIEIVLSEAKMGRIDFILLELWEDKEKMVSEAGIFLRISSDVARTAEGFKPAGDALVEKISINHLGVSLPSRVESNEISWEDPEWENQESGEEEQASKDWGWSFSWDHQTNFTKRAYLWISTDRPKTLNGSAKIGYVEELSGRKALTNSLFKEVRDAYYSISMHARNLWGWVTGKSATDDEETIESPPPEM